MQGPKKEGRERASWAEWEKGGKTGGARAEDGAGGGAGRILEVCAGKRGSVPGREASESRVDLEPRKKREWQKET